MNFRAWVHSIATAAITGGASAAMACIGDPQTYNLSLAGLQHLGVVFLVSAGLGVLALLKQSPLPPTISAPETK